MLRKRRVTDAALLAGCTRVLGYVRVSTDEQAKSGLSLDHQEEKIRQYCKTYDLELVRIERDEGISAKTLDRDGVAAVLDDLQRDRVDGLVIFKLDRLTRSVRDWADLIERFFSDKAGKHLSSVSDHVDTKTANGRMGLNLLMTVAQWEREIISERTADVLQAKIRKGERCGKIRFGYDLAPDGKTLVPNATEQKALALMHEWNDDNKTYREMIETLEAMGIECKQPGSIWRPCTIRQLLLRPRPSFVA